MTNRSQGLRDGAQRANVAATGQLSGLNYEYEVQPKWRTTTWHRKRNCWRRRRKNRAKHGHLNPTRLLQKRLSGASSAAGAEERHHAEIIAGSVSWCAPCPALPQGPPRPHAECPSRPRPGRLSPHAPLSVRPRFCGAAEKWRTLQAKNPDSSLLPAGLAK